MKNSRQQAAVRMTGGSPVAGAVGSAANQSARIFHRGGKAFQVCAGLDARTLICRDLQDGHLVEFTVEEIGLD